MSELQQYRKTHVQQYTAMQFDPYEGFPLDFLHDGWFISYGGTTGTLRLTPPVGGAHSEVDIKAGEWLVKTANAFVVLTNRDFEAQYELVPDE